MYDLIALAMQAKVPCLFVGSPGIGKTSSIQAVAAALSLLPCETVIASIREPSDFGGLPILHEGQVSLAPPSWAKRLFQAGKGVLFFDEITTVGGATQAALLRVILEGVVGDLTLPSAVTVIAAANPPHQASGGFELTPPLANRFCHLPWKLDNAAWAEGTLKGWAAPSPPRLPEGWEAQIPLTMALVTAFLSRRPDLLLAYPQEEAHAGGAWPSPRSWTAAGRVLAAVSAVVFPSARHSEIAFAFLAGCVGTGAAREFFSWKEAFDLPDPREVLADPEAYTLPERGDRRFAVIHAVIAYAVQAITEEKWVQGWKFLSHVQSQGAADMATVAAGVLAAHQKDSFVLPSKEITAFLPLLARVHRR